MARTKSPKNQQVASKDVVKELLDMTPAQRFNLETDQVCADCPETLFHLREPISDDGKVVHRTSKKPLRSVH